jgi:hypothetical protein
MKIRLILILLVIGLVACGRPLPGERPGPDRPTIGPTFPAHMPGAKTIYLGVAIRHPDVAGPVHGRITMVMDAVDTITQFHGIAAGAPLPLSTEVDSGFEYPMDINPGYPNVVLFKISGTVVGRFKGERVECWIRDSEYGYYSQNRTYVNPRVPSAVITAECFARIAPPLPE